RFAQSICDEIERQIEPNGPFVTILPCICTNRTVPLDVWARDSRTAGESVCVLHVTERIDSVLHIGRTEGSEIDLNTVVPINRAILFLDFGEWAVRLRASGDDCQRVAILHHFDFGRENRNTRTRFVPIKGPHRDISPHVLIPLGLDGWKTVPAF